MALRLSGDPEADSLLSEDPLALLIGMVLDQQVPLEWAFAAPAELKKRLGGVLDSRSIAAMDPEDLADAFRAKPSLHRYPTSMAQRVHELSRVVATRYEGDAAAVWSGSSDAKELLDRLKELPGFGDQKARIFLALLGKQMGVRPTGWEQASAPYGDPESFRSVADITDVASLERVRAAKAEAKRIAKAAATKTPKTTKGPAATNSPGTTKTPRTTKGPAAKTSKARRSS